MLSTSIYTTFSVKDDVATLAKKVTVLKKNIEIEKKRIAVYNTQWGTLTGMANIEVLKKKLMPELQIVSVDQIQNIDDYQSPEHFAQSNQLHSTF
jgi:hypothetical protein